MKKSKSTVLVGGYIADTLVKENRHKGLDSCVQRE